MARPLKNNADYFSHDNNMRNDTKILALRSKFGFEGYAVWNMLLEVLTDKEDFKISLGTLEMELLAGDFRIDSKKLKEIINYLIEIELLINDYDTDIYYSKNLIKRLRPVIENRERKREWAEKKWEKESKTELKTSKTKLSTSKSMQSKVKESKVNKIKENKKNFSNEKLHLSEQITEEPIEETYKTKKKIFKQKGLKYTPRKKSPKQETAWDTELLARYLKDETMLLHGVELYINKKDSGKHWKSLKDAIKKFGLKKCKEMVDFYLNSKKYNEWGSEPNKVFSDDSINIFNRSNKLKQKNEIGKPFYK